MKRTLAFFFLAALTLAGCATAELISPPPLASCDATSDCPPPDSGPDAVADAPVAEAAADTAPPVDAADSGPVDSGAGDADAAKG
jgi:hypothetical protein